ncbi:hypothetical protein ACOMHN_017644 [Nucella lapillus]
MQGTENLSTPTRNTYNTIYPEEEEDKPGKQKTTSSPEQLLLKLPQAPHFCLTISMPAFTRDSDAIRKLSTEIDMLRIHVRQPRLKLSETLRDMIKFCDSNMAGDHLINPEKENPFKPKKSCQIL